LAPYGLFLLLVEVSGRLPESFAGVMLAVKVGVPGALFAWFYASGRYPELRGYRPERSQLFADVAWGLAIALLWTVPFLLFAGLPGPGPEDGFNAGVFGNGRDGLAYLIRGFGFFAVTPFVEELFVRSFLIRFVDVYQSRGDFRKVPMARYSVWSFWVTVAWFTFSHVPWEWGVAFAAGILFNLLLYRRGHIAAPIIAHAVANASIFCGVLSGILPRGFL
jgi:CAAX prenyl protease-like protein